VSVLEGDEIVDIIIGSNRSNDLISIYYFNDNKAEMMSEVKTLDSNSHVNSWLNGIYGLCAITEGNSIFVSASNKDGMVNLLKIKSNGEEYSSELLFSFEFTSIIEGCVFSSNGFLYIAEENVGIWSINLDSFNVVPVLSLGEFSTVADLEGLTVFNYNGLTYLVVSSQGNSTFNVISVTSQPHHMGTFQIIDGNGIDKVTGADGIHLAYELSNEDFPLGVFIAQDNENEGNQNFKLVNWLYIVDVMKLINDE
jgi:3-phytase